MILPQSLPLSRPTLRYLDIYYQDILDHLRKQALDQWAKASVEARLAPHEQDAKLVALATHCQKRYLVEQCLVKYLHASALTMAETLLAPDNRTPEFGATPLWLHPLAPLSYRGEQVRGIFVYRPYDLVRFDENPYVMRLRPQERQWCRDFVLPFADRVEVALISEVPVEEGR